MTNPRPYSFPEHKRWIQLGRFIKLSRTGEQSRAVVARAAGIPEGRLLTIEMPVATADFPSDAELQAIAKAIGVDPQAWLDEAARIRADYGSAG